MVQAESEFPSQEIIAESEDAHLMAKDFFSSTLSLYSTGRSSPSIFWDRTIPSPLSDASVCKTKGREKSGECNSRTHRAVFTWVKGCWHSYVHWTGSGASFFSEVS